MITAFVILVIIICVLALAATKPARFNVQRSITVQAVPEKVFALIDDLRRWPEWSANEPEDSTVRRSYSGASAGKVRSASGKAREGPAKGA